MPRVGEAFYELTARDQAVMQSLGRVESKIRGSGTAAEASFGGTATGAFNKAGQAATSVERPVGRISGLMQDLSHGRGVKASFFGSDGFFGGSVNNATGALGKFGGAVKNVGGGIMTGLGIPPFLGYAAAAAVVVGGITKAIGAASDLQETQSKVGVVFGQSSGEILKWGETASTAFGQSKTQALGAAATFGNLFVALKLPSDEIPVMSTKLTELASDLASFNNVPVDDALLALRSGLTGETEPLRRFGVNLNEATIAQKALELGLIKSVKDGITPAIKAQATYALVLDQTKTAQGDFARTSDGLANQQRIAAAKMEDSFAKFGAKLLPIAAVIVPLLADALGSVLDAAGLLIDVISFLVTPLIHIGGVIVDVTKRFLDWVGSMPFVKAAIDILLAPLRFLADAIGFVASVVAGVAEAVGDGFDKMTGHVSEATSAATAAAKTMSDDLPADVAAGLDAGAGAVAEGAESGITTPIVDAAATARKEAVKEVKPTPFEIADALRAGIFDVKSATQDIRDAMENTLAPAKEIAAIEAFLASKRFTKALNDNRPEVRAAAEAWRAEAKDRLFALRNDVPDIALDTGTDYADALKSTKDKSHEAAIAHQRAITGPWSKLFDDAGEYGEDTGEAYAEGIADGIAHNTFMISTKVKNIQKMLEAGSPPKYRDSPLYGIDRWAFGTGSTYGEKFAEGVSARQQMVRAALTGLVAPPSFDARRGGMLSAFDDPEQARRRINFDPGSITARGNGVAIGMLKIDVDMTIERMNANSPADVLDLGRSLGNEIRLSLTRTPSAFFRVNG